MRNKSSKKFRKRREFLDSFTNFSYLQPVNSRASICSLEFPSMSVVVPFSIIPEMFIEVTDRFRMSARPYLMHKVQGKYQGLSYGEVRRCVELFALGLAALGVEKGDRGGIISENRPEWIIADMGTLFLGAFDVPVYPTLTAKQVEYIFNDSKVKLVVVSNQSQLAKVLKALPHIKSLRHVIIMGEQ